MSTSSPSPWSLSEEVSNTFCAPRSLVGVKGQIGVVGLVSKHDVVEMETYLFCDSGLSVG